MRRIIIEWRHLVVRNATCERCADTGDAIREAIDQLRREEPNHASDLVFREVPLSPFELEDSNTVRINGRLLEDILGAEVGENDCGSCGCLLGTSTDCRTLIVDGAVHEALPARLILEALQSVLAESAVDTKQTADTTR